MCFTATPKTVTIDDCERWVGVIVMLAFWGKPRSRGYGREKVVFKRTDHAKTAAAALAQWEDDLRARPTEAVTGDLARIRSHLIAAQGEDRVVLRKRLLQAAWLGSWCADRIGLDAQSARGLLEDAMCLAARDGRQARMFDLIRAELRTAGDAVSDAEFTQAALSAKQMAEAEGAAAA